MMNKVRNVSKEPGPVQPLALLVVRGGTNRLSIVKSRALTALPAFVATFGGVGVYVAVRDGSIVSVGLVLALTVVVGVVGLVVGRKMVLPHPVRGTLLVSAWILTLIAAGAVLTALFFWVGLRLPEWIATGAVSDEIEELSKVLLGAATAFVAVVFTDDLDKAEGELWPSTKTKDAFKTAFDGKFKPCSPEYDAAFEERVRPREGIAKVNGWGFVARYKRAKIIEGRPGMGSGPGMPSQTS